MKKLMKEIYAKLVKWRFFIYGFVFLIGGVFDFFTTLGSWALELLTGLVDQGSGFPDDYIFGIISLLLLILSFYFHKKNQIKKISIFMNILFLLFI